MKYTLMAAAAATLMSVSANAAINDISPQQEELITRLCLEARDAGNTHTADRICSGVQGAHFYTVLEDGEFVKVPFIPTHFSDEDSAVKYVTDAVTEYVVDAKLVTLLEETTVKVTTLEAQIDVLEGLGDMADAKIAELEDDLADAMANEAVLQAMVDGHGAALTAEYTKGFTAGVASVPTPIDDGSHAEGYAAALSDAELAIDGNGNYYTTIRGDTIQSTPGVWIEWANDHIEYLNGQIAAAAMAAQADAATIANLQGQIGGFQTLVARVQQMTGLVDGRGRFFIAEGTPVAEFQGLIQTAINDAVAQGVDDTLNHIGITDTNTGYRLLMNVNDHTGRQLRITGSSADRMVNGELIEATVRASVQNALQNAYNTGFQQGYNAGYDDAIAGNERRSF